MNTLKRLFIILMVALAVVGATVTVTQWNGQSQTQAAGFDRPQFDGNGADGQQFDHGDGDGGGRCGFGFGEVLKNVFIFGIIGALVVGATLLWDGWLKLWLKPKPALANTPSDASLEEERR
jgi:hypothetical protein